MKKKLVFVHFNRFLDKFDWERYELDLLSKKFEVKVHVLLNVVHPNLKNSKRYTLKTFIHAFRFAKKNSNQLDSFLSLFVNLNQHLPLYFIIRPI